MGNDNSFRCWVTGCTASEQNGPPAVVINYKEKGMYKAYKDASDYVEKNKEDGFCVVGPDGFLKCWKLQKGCEAKFERTSENVFLCYYNGELKLANDTKGEMKKFNRTDLYYYNST